MPGNRRVGVWRASLVLGVVSRVRVKYGGFNVHLGTAQANVY